MFLSQMSSALESRNRVVSNLRIADSRSPLDGPKVSPYMRFPVLRFCSDEQKQELRGL